MANKDAASYNAIFDVLKQRASGAGQEFNPTTILSDFESGLIASVATSFPDVRHRGRRRRRSAPGGAETFCAVLSSAELSRAETRSAGS